MRLTWGPSLLCDVRHSRSQAVNAGKVTHKQPVCVDCTFWGTSFSVELKVTDFYWVDFC